jgi:hypothetical protein
MLTDVKYIYCYNFIIFAVELRFISKDIMKDGEHVFGAKKTRAILIDVS